MTQLLRCHAGHPARSPHPAVARITDEQRPDRPSRAGSPARSRGGRSRRRSAEARRSPPAAAAPADDVAIQDRAVADDHIERAAGWPGPPRQRRGRIADGRRIELHEAIRAERRRPAHAIERRKDLVPVRVHPRGDDRIRRRVRAARCASASRAETPATRRRCTTANPCIVAMPIRSPVNDPGPDATANRSTSDIASPRRSSTRRSSPGSRWACVRDGSPPRSSTTRSSSTRATLPAGVVVSSANTRMR